MIMTDNWFSPIKWSKCNCIRNFLLKYLSLVKNDNSLIIYFLTSNVVEWTERPKVLLSYRLFIIIINSRPSSLVYWSRNWSIFLFNQYFDFQVVKAKSGIFAFLNHTDMRFKIMAKKKADFRNQCIFYF